MQTQKLSVKEQIVKTVVKSGNGGAVWVPKDWLGQEVVVILPEKPKLELKEKIIHLLEPYLKDVVSVGIYGSYARNEQKKDSDVDVLVITKDKNIKLSFKEDKLDIISFPIDKLKKAIEKYPTIYYQVVQEAEPLINAYILEELKNVKINKESFRAYLKETKEHLKSNKELLELDKIDNTYVKSYSVLYSSMLRLRGLLIIKSILKQDKFSNKKFKNWLMSKDLNLKEFEDSYKAYRLIRDNIDTKGLRIKINVAEKVLNILEKELNLLEAQIHGK
ncbi:nucleotidyltransferase domain-containing protein [Candidatus Woesearchaeota archaeon]|nr:nucleotidyltransferase domain-containing protein [Candidatus Woesearchaeota archaeon]